MAQTEGVEEQEESGPANQEDDVGNEKGSRLSVLPRSSPHVGGFARDLFKKSAGQAAEGRAAAAEEGAVEKRRHTTERADGDSKTLASCDAMEETNTVVNRVCEIVTTEDSLLSLEKKNLFPASPDAPSVGEPGGTASAGGDLVLTSSPSPLNSSVGSHAATLHHSSSRRRSYLQMTPVEAVRAFVLLQKLSDHDGLQTAASFHTFSAPPTGSTTLSHLTGSSATAAPCHSIEEEKRLQENAVSSLALKLSSGSCFILDLLALLKPFFSCARKAGHSSTCTSTLSTLTKEKDIKDEVSERTSREDEGGDDKFFLRSSHRSSSLSSEDSEFISRRSDSGENDEDQGVAPEVREDEEEEKQPNSFALKAQRRRRAAVLLGEVLQRVPSLPLTRLRSSCSAVLSSEETSFETPERGRAEGEQDKASTAAPREVKGSHQEKMTTYTTHRTDHTEMIEKETPGNQGDDDEKEKKKTLSCVVQFCLEHLKDWYVVEGACNALDAILTHHSGLIRDTRVVSDAVVVGAGDASAGRRHSPEEGREEEQGKRGGATNKQHESTESNVRKTSDQSIGRGSDTAYEGGAKECYRGVDCTHEETGERKKYEESAVCLIARHLLSDVHAPSFSQSVRQIIFRLILLLLREYREEMLLSIKYKRNSDGAAVDVIGRICEQLEGERDPRCLLLLFDIVSVLGCNYSSVMTKSQLEHAVDVVMTFFPVSFNPPANAPIPITEEMLVASFHNALRSSPLFSSFVLLYLLDCLASGADEEFLQTIEEVRKTASCVLPYYPASAALAALKPLQGLLIQLCYSGPSVYTAQLVSLWRLFLSRAMDSQDEEEQEQAREQEQRLRKQPVVHTEETASSEFESSQKKHSAASGGSSASLSSLSSKFVHNEKNTVEDRTTTAAGYVICDESRRPLSPRILSVKKSEEGSPPLRGLADTLCTLVPPSSFICRYPSWFSDEVRPLLEELFAPLREGFSSSGATPSRSAAQRFLFASATASLLSCRCCIEVCILPLLELCIDACPIGFVEKRQPETESSETFVSLTQLGECSSASEKGNESEKRHVASFCDGVGRASDDTDDNTFPCIHVEEEKWSTALLCIAPVVDTLEKFMTICISEKPLLFADACPKPLAAALFVQAFKLVTLLGRRIIDDERFKGYKLLRVLSQTACLSQQHPSLSAIVAWFHAATLLGCSDLSTSSFPSSPLLTSFVEKQNTSLAARDVEAGSPDRRVLSSPPADSHSKEEPVSSPFARGGGGKRRDIGRFNLEFSSVEGDNKKSGVVNLENQQRRQHHVLIKKVKFFSRLHGLSRLLAAEDDSPLLQVLRPLQQALLGSGREILYPCFSSSPSSFGDVPWSRATEPGRGKHLSPECYDQTRESNSTKRRAEEEVVSEEHAKRKTELDQGVSSEFVSSPAPEEENESTARVYGQLKMFLESHPEFFHPALPAQVTTALASCLVSLLVATVDAVCAKGGKDSESAGDRVHASTEKTQKTMCALSSSLSGVSGSITCGLSRPDTTGYVEDTTKRTARTPCVNSDHADVSPKWQASSSTSSSSSLLAALSDIPAIGVAFAVGSILLGRWLTGPQGKSALSSSLPLRLSSSPRGDEEESEDFSLSKLKASLHRVGLPRSHQETVLQAVASLDTLLQVVCTFFLTSARELPSCGLCLSSLPSSSSSLKKTGDGDKVKASKAALLFNASTLCLLHTLVVYQASSPCKSQFSRGSSSGSSRSPSDLRRCSSGQGHQDKAQGEEAKVTQQMIHSQPMRGWEVRQEKGTTSSRQEGEKDKREEKTRGRRKQIIDEMGQNDQPGKRQNASVASQLEPSGNNLLRHVSFSKCLENHLPLEGLLEALRCAVLMTLSLDEKQREFLCHSKQGSCVQRRAEVGGVDYSQQLERSKRTRSVSLCTVRTLVEFLMMTLPKETSMALGLRIVDLAISSPHSSREMENNEEVEKAEEEEKSGEHRDRERCPERSIAFLVLVPAVIPFLVNHGTSIEQERKERMKVGDMDLNVSCAAINELNVKKTVLVKEKRKAKPNAYSNEEERCFTFRFSIMMKNLLRQCLLLLRNNGDFGGIKDTPRSCSSDSLRDGFLRSDLVLETLESLVLFAPDTASLENFLTSFDGERQHLFRHQPQLSTGAGEEGGGAAPGSLELGDSCKQERSLLLKSHDQNETKLQCERRSAVVVLGGTFPWASAYLASNLDTTVLRALWLRGDCFSFSFLDKEEGRSRKISFLGSRLEKLLSFLTVVFKTEAAHSSPRDRLKDIRLVEEESDRDRAQISSPFDTTKSSAARDQVVRGDATLKPPKEGKQEKVDVFYFIYQAFSASRTLTSFLGTPVKRRIQQFLPFLRVDADHHCSHTGSSSPYTSFFSCASAKSLCNREVLNGADHAIEEFNMLPSMPPFNPSRFLSSSLTATSVSMKRTYTSSVGNDSLEETSLSLQPDLLLAARQVLATLLPGSTEEGRGGLYFMKRDLMKLESVLGAEHHLYLGHPMTNSPRSEYQYPLSFHHWLVSDREQVKGKNMNGDRRRRTGGSDNANHDDVDDGLSLVASSPFCLYVPIVALIAVASTCVPIQEVILAGVDDFPADFSLSVSSGYYGGSRSTASWSTAQGGLLRTLILWCIRCYFRKYREGKEKKRWMMKHKMMEEHGILKEHDDSSSCSSSRGVFCLYPLTQRLVKQWYDDDTDGNQRQRMRQACDKDRETDKGKIDSPPGRFPVDGGACSSSSDEGVDNEEPSLWLLRYVSNTESMFDTMEMMEDSLLCSILCLLLSAQRHKRHLRDLATERGITLLSNGTSSRLKTVKTGGGKEALKRKADSSSSMSQGSEEGEREGRRMCNEKTSSNTDALEELELGFLDVYASEILRFLLYVSRQGAVLNLLERKSKGKKSNMLHSPVEAVSSYVNPILRLLAIQALINYSDLSLFSCSASADRVEAVISGIAPALGDPVRLVRRSAAVCRNRWWLLKECG